MLTCKRSGRNRMDFRCDKCRILVVDYRWERGKKVKVITCECGDEVGLGPSLASLEIAIWANAPIFHPGPKTLQ